MALLKELRVFARGPLARHEALAAGSWGRMIAFYVMAGIVDVAAVAVLAADIGLPPAGRHPEWPIGAMLVIAVILVLFPITVAVGLAATAISGDRAEDTLEALVLTPMDRREIVWAKLLGRTAPVRRFMLAAAPAWVACFSMPILSALRPWESGPYALLDWAYNLTVAAVLAALPWASVFVLAHFAAAVALYFSARTRHSWLAALAAYAFIFLPQPVVLLFCPLVFFYAALSVFLFDSLVKNFDAYALGEPVQGMKPRIYPRNPLSLLRRKVN